MLVYEVLQVWKGKMTLAQFAFLVGSGLGFLLGCAVTVIYFIVRIGPKLRKKLEVSDEH